MSNANSIAEISELLGDLKFQEVQDIFKTCDIDELKEYSWELVLPYFLALEKLHRQENVVSDAYVKVCDSIIGFLLKLGSPKELLLALLNSSREVSTSYAFEVLIESIALVLRRHEGEKSKLVQWIFEALQAFVEKLPRPPDHEFQTSEERLLTDLDDEVRQFVACQRSVQRLVEELLNEYKSDKPDYYNKLICFCMINFTGTALLDIDCTWDQNRSKSTARVLCEKFCSLLGTLIKDLTKVYEFSAERNVRLEGNEYMGEMVWLMPEIRVAHCAYLCIAEQLVDLIPSVYNSIYVLELNLKCVQALTQSQNSITILKGLALLKAVLSPVNNFALTCENLLLSDHLRVLRALFRVMISCPVDETRNTAVELYELYAKKMEITARVGTYSRLFEALPHGSCRAFIIDHFRVDLVQHVETKESLTPFLKLITRLPTSIGFLEYSECVLAVLGFIKVIHLHKMATSEHSDVVTEFLDGVGKEVKSNREQFEWELEGARETQKKSNGVTSSQEVKMHESNLNRIFLIGWTLDDVKMVVGSIS